VNRITLKDLKDFQHAAQAEFEKIGPNIQLVGASKSLTEGEQLALAFMIASLTTWSRRAVLRPDWDKKVNLEMLSFNSEVETE
jgi:hypothetical protein